MKLFPNFTRHHLITHTYLGWRYDRQFLLSDDEESSDEDVDDEPSLRLFRNLHHIFQDEINNGVYKCAPAA